MASEVIITSLREIGRNRQQKLDLAAFQQALGLRLGRRLRHDVEVARVLDGGHQTARQRPVVIGHQRGQIGAGNRPDRQGGALQDVGLA
jgi:ribosomal protein S5